MATDAVVLMGINGSMILNALFCIILVTATVSNSLLLLVFYRRPGLRSVSNRFVINLLVTNLVTCWVLLPLLLFDNIWRKTTVGADFVACNYVTVCAIKEGIAVGLCATCVLSVLMIGIDQYYAVIDPLRYHSAINATTSVVMMAVSWSVSACFGVFGSLSINERSTWFACERLGHDHFAFLPRIYHLIFPIIFVALIFIVPFASICWIYVSICSAAHQNNERTRRNGSSNNCVPSDTNAMDYTIVSTIHECEEYDDEETKPKRRSEPAKLLHHSSTKSSLKSTSSSIVNTLKHRISNASMFKYREETRAARISVLVILMTLMCWLPFTLMLLIHSPLLGNITLPHYVKKIGILSLSLNTVVSPLIFAHRNRRIHRELCKLFRVSNRRPSFCSTVRVAKCRSGTFKKRPIYVTAETKNNELLVSLMNDNYLTMKSTGKSVSILNRMWNIAKEVENTQNTLKLPTVALDTDTSRSSFSSNASSGSNRLSTSAASFSDAAEEV